MPSTSPTTVTNLAVAMFAVRDQDASIAFYRDTLGWELRTDLRFGPNQEYRWVEVAPPGSVARLALTSPMDGEPGGASIGVETPDLQAEHDRLRGLDGVDVDEQLMPGGGGAPAMFALRDPDRNAVWVTETP